MDLLTVPEAARAAGITANTLRTWARDYGLPTEDRHGKVLISPAALRAFVEENPQLPAARRADAALGSFFVDSARPAAPATAPALGAADERDEARALRARIATLDEELGAAVRDAERLRQERDVWRARARAHRNALRAQLDLEEASDSPA